MASQLAIEIVKTVDDEGYYDRPAAGEDVDGKLAEVREVLEGLQTFWIDQGDETPVEWHWCDPDTDCADECQRARALYEKLVIK